MTRYYPAYLDLTERRCVVIGAGVIAERKATQLLASGADVTLVSATATDELERLADQRKLRWIKRDYAKGDLAGAMLAIAATDDEDVNRQVHAEAQREKTLLNVVDVTPLCGFIAPSIIERGPVTVAISTAGTSPALARKLRELMDGGSCGCLEWADAAGVLAEVRAELRARKATVPPEAWQQAMDDELLEMVENGQEAEAKARLLDTLLAAAKS
ncbi:MAG: bifunctional precorrin-2 dehydrogenase/sirohydrochlorin ferrochelatase [Dehalococcoidia bacterium]